MCGICKAREWDRLWRLLNPKDVKIGVTPENAMFWTSISPEVCKFLEGLLDTVCMVEKILNEPYQYYFKEGKVHLYMCPPCGCVTSGWYICRECTQERKDIEYRIREERRESEQHQRLWREGREYEELYKFEKLLVELNPIADALHRQNE